MIENKSNNGKTLVSKLTSGRSGQMKSYVAILLVSVGKENFEAEAIESAVKMINQEFKACCIVVADTLQRYNIATEKSVSEKDAYEEALKKGDEWLVRYNSYFLNNFKIPFEIVRWDSLISDDDFIQQEKKFSCCIEANEVLSNAMRESIDEYGKRLFKNMGESYFKQIESQHEKNCFSYLKEECVAITLLPKKIFTYSSDFSPLVIVYPGKSTSILTENRNTFILDEYDEIIRSYGDYLNWISYRFNRLKQHEVDAVSKILPAKLKINDADLKSEEFGLKQVSYINSISEAQLEFFSGVFDAQSLFEFKKHLLAFFLEDNSFYLDEELLCGLLSIKSTAYIFHKQLMLMFNRLEKKLSNQCKANMVRILKRENVAFLNEEKDVVFRSAMID